MRTILFGTLVAAGLVVVGASSALAVPANGMVIAPDQGRDSHSSTARGLGRVTPVRSRFQLLVEGLVTWSSSGAGSVA